jgi:transcriptional regulator of heat shock response
MDRKQEVLKAIIQHFIHTGEPVGSQTIIVSYKFSVSPATIRNDMVALEKEELIFQPHTSAGRVPTDKGYRVYVNELADINDERQQAITILNQLRQEFVVERIKEKIYEAVSLLSRATQIVSFATLPDNNRTFFLGISNVMRQPEFLNDMVRACQVIEVLEKQDNFITLLKNLHIDETTKIFIGKENILPQIQSCSLMVTKYQLKDYHGYMGLLGPTRTNYPFNQAILEEIKKALHH